jgi:phage shock protein A
MEDIMGIFKRTKDIFTANINSWLDKAENPEAMINQIIREVEVTISDLKCSTATQLAEKKGLERRTQEAKSVAKRWQERAELAVKEGKDDLAKEALKEFKMASNKIIQMEEDFSRIDSNVDVAREQVAQLELKLIEMINKKKDLLSRIDTAEKKSETNRVMNMASGVDLMEKFSRFESKIERLEAEAEVFATNLDAKFEDLEADKAIEDELEALKAKLSGKKSQKESN